MSGRVGENQIRPHARLKTAATPAPPSRWVWPNRAPAPARPAFAGNAGRCGPVPVPAWAMPDLRRRPVRCCRRHAALPDAAATQSGWHARRRNARGSCVREWHDRRPATRAATRSMCRSTVANPQNQTATVCCAQASRSRRGMVVAPSVVSKAKSLPSAMAWRSRRTPSCQACAFASAGAQPCSTSSLVKASGLNQVAPSSCRKRPSNELLPAPLTPASTRRLPIAYSDGPRVTLRPRRAGVAIALARPAPSVAPARCASNFACSACSDCARAEVAAAALA